MRSIIRAALISVCTVMFCVLINGHALAEATKFRVTAQSPIEGGDVAGAQSEAQAKALENAVVKALYQMVPGQTYAVLEPLFSERILPRAEQFVTHYQIVDRDVSDLAYTVKLSVTVDTDLLHKTLTRLGVLKGPGSPPLGAVFITINAPLSLDQVKTLGTAAQNAASKALEGPGLVFIPPTDKETGFRVIRPPQTLEALVSGGRASAADLALGLLFEKNGEVAVTEGGLTIPMHLTITVADVKSEALIGTTEGDLDVKMSTREGTTLEKSFGQRVSEMAGRLSQVLSERYLAPDAAQASIRLIFEGKHDAATVKGVMRHLRLRLGEDTSILPVRFSFQRSEYVILTSRNVNEVVEALSAIGKKPDPFRIAVQDGNILLLTEEGKKPGGVLEFGQEVTFYRRLPVPGVENPEDIRKMEFVSWQELEDNSQESNANIAPVGMGILGRIDPLRDLDFYRFQLPNGAKDASVSVEQAGPDEVRPRVRVFSGGRLIADQVASSRGRNLFFSFTVSPDSPDLLVSVEDYLGRYTSMFPYVLKLMVTGTGKADEPS